MTKAIKYEFDEADRLFNMLGKIVIRLEEIHDLLVDIRDNTDRG